MINREVQGGELVDSSTSPVLVPGPQAVIAALWGQTVSGDDATLSLQTGFDKDSTNDDDWVEIMSGVTGDALQLFGVGRVGAYLRVVATSAGTGTVKYAVVGTPGDIIGT